MEKSKNSKTRWIWLSVMILLVCIAVTAIILFFRLDSYVLDDSGAISLITGDICASNDISVILDARTPDSVRALATNTVSASNNTVLQSSARVTDVSLLSTASVPAVMVLDNTQPNYGFESYDDKTTWSTNTQVEIFRVSYVNGEQFVTVNSGNGDKVIAPGTENTYTFKLKNTGNVALDYTVELDAYFTPADIKIPIVARLNRYDGAWVVGGKKDYAAVSVLDAAEDSEVLGAGKYTYYTLDWRWPFEGGDDELDTMLGNLADEQDLTFTIVIKTTATESLNPDDDSGLTPPYQTGDEASLRLVLVGVLVIALIGLLSYKSKVRRLGRA